MFCFVQVTMSCHHTQLRAMCRTLSLAGQVLLHGIVIFFIQASLELDLGYVVKLPRCFKACVAFVKHESTQPHFALLRSRPAFMGSFVCVAVWNMSEHFLVL